MKRLFLSAIFSISAVVNAQQRIRSIHLDSAIYNQINNVRLQNNKPALKKFLFNEMLLYQRHLYKRNKLGFRGTFLKKHNENYFKNLYLLGILISKINSYNDKQHL